ncbi:ABC transporter substrate-binding protein [Nesterenkonia alba]|uniref:ABC transporter substrate-binding protein n=1 Tax=Nesterenkonia alba TaxID=515814 RepID=UPI0003B37F89|nr:ABC transporter substrate-binding protein [Nesterenkonia alba]
MTATTGALALALTACGNGGNGDDDEVTLTFTWWGGDTRHAYTEEMIELFEEENPGITIEPQYGEWDGYWDQLATQAAAQDLPDVVQMDQMYLGEYVQNGVLNPIETVDTSEFPEELLASGEHDGELYGMPVGSTASVLAMNEEFFEEAGVEIPDDTTWTWDDYVEITAEISENTDGYGMAQPFGDGGFEIWLRQHYGVDNVDAEGNLEWEPAQAEGYFELLGQMQEAGSFPSTAEISEDRGATLEQTYIATGQAALDGWWDTNLIALSANEGVELTPVMMPSETGNAAEAQMYYKASMMYSVYAGSDHPEEAELFIDFMVNNEQALELQEIERGIPGNESVRDAIRDDLDEIETSILEYNEGLEDVVADPPPLPPEGFGAVQDIVFRYEEEFLFGNLSAAEAAEGMHQEIEEALN